MLTELNNVDRLRQDVGHLLVRRAIDRDDWVPAALFDIVTGDKTDWDVREVRAALHDFHACRLRVSDWLDLNS